MALLLGSLPGVEHELDWQVTLVTPGLRAGKLPAFVVFRDWPGPDGHGRRSRA